MKKRWKRRALWATAVGLTIPAVIVVAYIVLRPTPPAGAPRIGLSMASSFVIHRPTYEAALARAGGEAVLLTPTDELHRVAEMLDRVDALLLTGGDDIDPALYGGETGTTDSVDRRRDDFEIALIQEAIKRDMPILAICRGIQILNVAHGGSVRNLREDQASFDRHGPGLDSFSAHDVTIKSDSILAGLTGAGTRRVNSFHTQGVGRVGEMLSVTATAEDGLVEGVERKDRTFVVGIQWHPEIEALTDSSALALFRELVRQAEAQRESPSSFESESNPGGN